VSPQIRAAERGNVVTRVVAVGALVLAAILVALMVLGGDGGVHYKLRFQTGGQLVTGNQVLVAGRPVGSVESIELTDDNEAEVEIELSEPITEGTTAVIRASSLSGIANRYVSLRLGPEGAPELDDGTVIGGAETTSPVDLDQLFDAFRPKTRRGLQKVIQGFAAIYAGVGEEANRTFEFLNPALVGGESLFAELNRDRKVLRELVTQGSRSLGAIAERREDLADLVGNANQALGAIAAENSALDRSLSALAPTLRQANTTFVNLRTALDDLDPLVETSLTATEDLTPFLRELRPVARRGVPVFTDLNAVLKMGGKANDLKDLLADLPDTRKRAESNVPRIITGLDAFQPVLEFARPYFPDLLGWLTKFGQATAYYDANGHYARVTPAGANAFEYNSGTEELDPIYQLDPFPQFEFYDTTPGARGLFLRCPGSATQAIAGSNPFLDDGNLGPDDCDPADVPIGP
jgi:phospholipid/cholesterol/gamma-HCH transport system substrate-binding protein